MVDLMTSEDFKALEAALAFFDDCDDGFSSDLSSDDKAGSSKESSMCISEFLQTDRVFRLNGLCQITHPYSKTNMQPLSATSTYIELLKCIWMPFDYRFVAKGFFSKITSGCGLKEVESNKVGGARKHNVAARALTVEIEERVKIQYRYAGIRYSEHKREVLVLAGQNQLLEALGVALDGVSFSEKCCRSGMVRRADVILLEACENLAKRQLMLRREAEHENENLRELVKGHVKTVKTLKRLFQRQNIDKIPRSAWLFNVRTHTNADNTFSVLQQLSGTLGDVFGDTDRVFRSNGLSVIRTPFSRQNTQLLSTSTAYIEILKCDLLPFDFRVLGKALMGGMATNLENSEEKYLQSQFQDSVVARATTAEVNGHIKIRYRLTGTNYHEQKREVIVVSGNHELLELFGEAVDSVCCQEKTWCVLTEESPGLCRLQLCMGITLQIPQLSKGTRPFFNRACEMLATLYQKMFESVTSGIEQALLAA
ncbi:uncharacterized protein IUM83_01065 [Phytophthora cinnamomi]|uniref:uncharacterized protein n=1 Tax=Phytophthora cinnamomi TaxID=4785 RepID=UPI003559E8D7|nr:hypothetical protein IUM83_01065 [Phytophthora cinnamomi]